jgi:cytochrome P450
MGGELMGWKNILGLTRYSDRFRTHRKHFHQVFGSQATFSKFHAIEESETQKFLQKLLDSPQKLISHIEGSASAIILRITYGYEVKGETDEFVKLVQDAMLEFATATAIGAFMVDLVPFLRYVPAWVPGAGFQSIAKRWARDLMRMIDEPYEWTKAQISAEKATPSFITKSFEKTMTDEEERILKWSAGSMYAGGGDTTVASIRAFFLVMALYPEVQARAQAEIDEVVGNDRLPLLSDRSRLPYVDALTSEVLRYHSVAPTGVPHSVIEDDVYGDYLIPKGSTVIANIWNMLHDPCIYEDPTKFNPSRFIRSADKEPELDPREICFGFGRRICPGRLLADASVFITCAMTLATFDVKKLVKDGKIIEPVIDQTTGTVSHPVPFECTIQPRSAKAVSLIMASQDSH